MAKIHSLQARFAIRDKKFPVILYRNQKWSLGITLNDPLEFDVKTGRLTGKYRGLDKDEINKTIQKRYNTFNKLIAEALEKGVDTVEFIKSRIEEEEAKLRKFNVDFNTKISDAFFDYMQSKGFNKDIEQGRTFARYKSQWARLKDFETENKKRLGHINADWAEAFANFLATPFKKEYDISDVEKDRYFSQTKTLSQTNSTISRYLIDIIAMCKYISKSNLDLKFDTDKIKAYVDKLPLPESYVNNIIVLNKRQIEDFKNFVPRKNLSWEVKIYDLFLFCLNTGLRFSDVIRLNDDYIITDSNGNEIITMEAQKTRGKFTVPLNHIALDIFNKYNRDFRGKFPSNQQINKNLMKMLKRIPSMCVKVEITECILMETKKLKIPFYEAVSFHDSRKTYVSRIISLSPTTGLLPKVMRLTGWTDIRTLNHYLQVFGSETNTSDLDTLNML